MPEPHAPSRSPESPVQERERLRALVVEQAAPIEQLRERIQELEARLAQDSHNSSKPPSSDPPFRKPPPCSQRQPSGRQPGGQAGRRGVTRRLAEDPDQGVIIPLSGTCACGRCCAEIGAEVLPERRQVVEVVIQRAVTEYRFVGGTCTCGRVQRSAFPEGVTATVQYGPGVSALAVYLTQSQLLPYQGTADLFQELAGIALSPGTLQGAVTVAATHLEAPVAAIHGALLTTPVAHADETGGRVNGGLHWLHVLSTAELTAYLPGVLVHDHGSAYARYSVPPCLLQFPSCELTAIAEAIPSQQWATDRSALLWEANAQVNADRAQGLAMLSAGAVERLQDRYDAILTAAEATNPRHPRRPSIRGRVKRSPAYNLIDRLREYCDEVLRFIADLRVPFDNNQAERNLRMPKPKQKVSGCFRSETRVDAFAMIRSYLSTLRKQSANLFQSLVPTSQSRHPKGVLL